MLKKDELPYCPVSTTMEVIGSKWKIIILQKLQKRSWRFNELLKEIDGLSKHVLSETLRSMENQYIIEKKIIVKSPFHPEYCLSELGISLLPVLKEMEKWGIFYKSYLQNICRQNEDDSFK